MCDRKEQLMRKSALVVLMLLAMTMSASAAIVTGSFADAKAQSALLGKPLLIDFATDW